MRWSSCNNLVTIISFLTLYSSSHARLESKLNLLIAEVRAGKREGSVISTQTFDTTARNDRETWEALRRELEDIGISPGIITEKRQFIIAWFQEAVAAGKLEEDVVPTDSNSVISSHEFQSRADSGDDDYIPTREMSSMMIESSTTERRVAPRSEPGALRHLRQPADQLSSPPSPKKRSTRIRVTYLLQKLLGRDQQFLEAALSGDISTVTKLLDKGVDIETKASWDRLGMRTALQLMSDLGRDRIVQFLLSRGADVHAKDEYGNTAVHMAAGHDYKIVVDLLLKHGADIESKDSDGNTALLHATKSGYEDMVRLLVERGAEIESKDSNGTTALMIAAGQGREDMVWLLLEQGAEIESEDSNGYTALMFAVEEGRQETVQILLDGGAKIGDTVLKLAKRWSRQEIIRILQSSGASRSSSRKKSVPPSEWTRMTSQYLNSKP